LQAFGFLYRKKFSQVGFCVYCGDPATDFDHVLPVCKVYLFDLNVITRKRFPQAFCMVPCCKSCNSLAGQEIFFWIKEKRRYIQEKLRNKNIKKLRTVMWDADEIAELGPNMKNEVLYYMRTRRRLEQRILHPARLPEFF